MKKRSRLIFGMLAVMLALGMLLSGCASLTWNAAVTETGSVSALKTAEDNAGGKEIANYTVILGVFELGRATFTGLVVAAARAGKTIDIMTTNHLVVQKVIAYAR
jgi:hypothetical protein